MLLRNVFPQVTELLEYRVTIIAFMLQLVRIQLTRMHLHVLVQVTFGSEATITILDWALVDPLTMHILGMLV